MEARLKAGKGSTQAAPKMKPQPKSAAAKVADQDKEDSNAEKYYSENISATDVSKP